MGLNYRLNSLVNLQTGESHSLSVQDVPECRRCGVFSRSPTSMRQ